MFTALSDSNKMIVQGGELSATACEICSLWDVQILCCPCQVGKASRGDDLSIATILLTGMLMCLAYVPCSAADSFVDIASQVSIPLRK